MVSIPSACITLLRYALHTGNAGGSMGHFYDMTGMASGNVHRTVYSEGRGTGEPLGGDDHKTSRATGGVAVVTGQYWW